MAQGTYADVNGLKLYYEIYGTGRPLVLLHGGLGGISMFAPILPGLAQTRQIVGVDLAGHGRTADRDLPFSFEAMADDVAAFIKQFSMAPVDIAGYSLGAGVALQTAIRHPELVRKLVVISAPYQRNGWYPEVLQGMAAMNVDAAKAMIGSPPHQAYASVAPKPENWSQLVGKTGDLLRQEYDWSHGVAGLKMPVLLVFGDADAVRPAHIVEFYALLGGGQRDAGWDGSAMPVSRLAVLPGTTHYNSFMSPLLAPIIADFLDAPLPGA